MLILPRNIQALACCAGACLQSSFCTWGNFNRRKWGFFNRRKLGNIQPALTHHLSKAAWSLSNLASMLRLNLFTYRELKQWIDNPMGTPPLIPVAEQLTLALV